MAIRARHRAAVSDPQAWGLSILIHVFLLLWLLLWPREPRVLDLPPSEPLVVSLVDLGGPAGDTTLPVKGIPAAGVPNARPVAERPVPATEAAPKEVRARPRRARAKAARTTEAEVPPAPPPVRPEVAKAEPAPPDALALARELERRRQAQASALGGESEPGGGPAGAAGQDASPAGAPGGAVSTGTGNQGNLAGRRILARPEPEYPHEARARLAEGSVRAVIRVAPTGEVLSVRLQRSSGDEALDAAALTAFRRWRFSPLPEGSPEQEGLVSARFQLR
ncbi:MAG: TonB family protein [Candidatus Sericytochromatia bacterium]|nr:TonB family protein [Candidatus Sericytochromatia bacterium]